MKTTRFFLSLIVLSVLWCTEVFAHDEIPNCVDNNGDGYADNYPCHFTPGYGLDPCNKLTDKSYCGAYDGEGNLHPEYVGGHGHIKSDTLAAYWKKGQAEDSPSTSTSSTSTTTSTPTSSTTTTTTTPTSSTPTTTTTTTTTTPVATTLSKISGDNQQGPPGEALANPFVVQVQDQNGNPLQGTTVTFAVTAGGGTLTATTPTTDANGQAQTTLTLGSMLGTNTVQARVQGIDQIQVFSAKDSLLDSVRAAVADTTGSTPESVQLYRFELQLQQGWNLIHLPLTVYMVDNQLLRIQTAADLYELIQPTFMFIHGEDGFIGTHEESDIALGPNQGIAVLTDEEATFTLIGARLPDPFQFERGLNFLGIPRQSVALQGVSDWLRVYEESLVVVTAVDGKFHTVGRAGDSGDHGITGGQSFFIYTTAPRETFFYGPAWGTRIE